MKEKNASIVIEIIPQTMNQSLSQFLLNVKKNWSYHMKISCKNKYEKNNSKTPVCDSCNIPHGERDNISIQRNPSPLIKSQYVSPISSVISSTDLMDPMMVIEKCIVMENVKKAYLIHYL